MDEETMNLAYMAGVMDGDGSFSLIKRASVNGQSPLYYPVIQLANSFKGLIDFFRDKFGGSHAIKKAKISPEGVHRKDSHQWKLEKLGPCAPFLDKIIPFLVVKQDRAKFLREYIERNPFKRGSNRLTPEILFEREKDYWKMREFNEEGTMNKVLSKKTLNPNFWPYMAGLMDTDGSFSIRKEISKTHMKAPCYTVIISLSMIDPRGFNHIQHNFSGGKIKVVKAKTCREGICYRFVISSTEQAIDFINKCLPYLKVKPEAAKVLLDFCKNKGLVSYRRDGTPEDFLKFREQCYQNLCSLNKYGVYKPSLIDLEA
jgi:hypothetical protein